MLKDSGKRRKFPGGAVRDISEGKGRCDLLPLSILGDEVLKDIASFQRTGAVSYLRSAYISYKGRLEWDWPTALLEVSHQFEDGAVKYGDNNWRKGIPARCYIDSAVRHYLKWVRGDTDEPHDRACLWNILCCIWTVENLPELNDYAENHKAALKKGDK